MSEIDWLKTQANWAYAHGRPIINGSIKADPNDFIVDEIMPVVPSGEGEHLWVNITKTRQNTESVAKQLAKFARVSQKDVGYSGLKDFNAITTQWFSLWLPKEPEFKLGGFEMSGVEINELSRHNRKLKRGTHRHNRFSIVIRDLSKLTGDSCLDVNDLLDDKLIQINKKGVPNFFGEQRFGRQFNNMNQVSDMFDSGKKIKNRHLRSLLISSARSWLFNVLVSERIQNDTWDKLQTNEPANLEGTSSVFISEGTEDETNRCDSLDIHPTAPLWGEINKSNSIVYSDLFDWEINQIEQHQNLIKGLENIAISYQRRSIRSKVKDLTWEFLDSGIKLDFELGRGEYATSVLRELILS